MSIGAIAWRWRLLMIALVLGVATGLVVEVAVMRGRHVVTGATTSKSAVESSTTVTLPRGQDLFEPFILTVQVNTVVAWRNEDDTTHVFSTTPQRSSFLNPQAFSFQVNPGGEVIFRFTVPGIYHYYETEKDGWNTTFSRVVARQGLRHYPLSMEGVIFVQGPFSGLPHSAINFVVQGQDIFASEFIAIATNSAVTWHNLDSDSQFVGLVPGWAAPVNPVDIGLYRIASTDETPGGGSITVLFSRPGLYYYYSHNNDEINSQARRAQALMVASEYPIPMEGFVLVA